MKEIWMKNISKHGKNMRKKILNIGSITKDCIITPHETYNQIGGAVYYQLSTLNQLKVPNTSIILIGEDDLEMLNNLDEKTIKTIKTQKTMQYINKYDKDNNRTQKAYLPKEAITPEKIDINMNEYDNAIISPLSKYEIPIKTLKYIKEKNIETTLLIQGYVRDTDKNNNIIKRKWNNYDKYLKYTDILCCDEEELKTALDKKQITDEEIFHLIKKHNLKEIIITKSIHGSSIYTKTEKVNIPCIKTENEIDHTGLGDTYITAYTYKKQETDIYTAGLFASITAKNKLETKGTLKSTKEEIENELDKILNQISQDNKWNHNCH